MKENLAALKQNKYIGSTLMKLENEFEDGSNNSSEDSLLSVNSSETK